MYLRYSQRHQIPLQAPANSFYHHENGTLLSTHSLMLLPSPQHETCSAEQDGA